MLYKKIALCLLLLFSQKHTYPMEWIKNNPIKSLSATMIILGIYKVREGITRLITEMFLWSLYKKISKNNHWILARCFIFIGKGEKLLFHAYHYNRELFIFLIKNGANPNVIYRGTTPYLNEVCFSQDEDLVKILLEYGADPNAKNKIYDYSQCLSGGVECYEYDKDVLENGSPLYIAFFKANKALITLLMKYNARPLYYIPCGKRYIDPNCSMPSNYVKHYHNGDTKWSNKISPYHLLERSDYTTFNYLLDYVLQQDKTSYDTEYLHKYFLIKEAIHQKDIVITHIMPHLILKNFDEYIHTYIKYYVPKNISNLQFEQQFWKNNINDHKEKILQKRFDQKNQFLPMILSPNKQ